MASDPFDELLDIENNYYKEGYDAGVVDSTYAGLVEGKVFGVEKGYEKALELGKHRGRALVWQRRLGLSNASGEALREVTTSSAGTPTASTLSDAAMMRQVCQTLPRLSTNARLQRHVEALSIAADPASVAKDNSDEAVTEFDERIAKARAKAKVIATIVGETFNPTSTGNTGIEDSTGLNARQ
ncbi:uncharacterized protein A1O9_06909 [Exophiala aquamarina CBS 119918]|uniref:Uncharacterized protein n=1 Tax=Exophiala aquamarina CBS 119918 TaxID=1182545 RepID=A0A072P9D1_9EURO|nr:uncharacterized protein A1O9_06909 [Exophiala aquamarina CBS 119918]KEF56719.1 hypothetical protein A1O9_06909 [Exophiala aquamarina CBS 119918]